jgi:hypothetical protein
MMIVQNIKICILIILFLWMKWFIMDRNEIVPGAKMLKIMVIQTKMQLNLDHYC